MSNVKKRQDVKIEDTWDLESLFPSMKAVEDELNNILKSSKELVAFSGKLGNKEDLLFFLQKLEEIQIKLHQTGIYCTNKLNENIGDDGANALIGMFVNVETEYSSAISFFDPEIIENADIVAKLISFPEFKPYQNTLLRTIRNKVHTLSKEQEMVIASFGLIADGFEDAFNSLTNVDLNFGFITAEDKNEKLTISNISTFLLSPNRDVRKEAWTKFRVEFESHKNILAQLYKNSIKQNIVHTNLRKFNSTLEAALFSDNISLDVYHNLTETVKKNLAPLHKYYKIRKDLFNFPDGLKPYDLTHSIVKGYKKVVSYNEGVDLVIKSLAPLGEEYTSILKFGLLQDRWVDKYENEGKESGAYSYSAYNGKNYIKMNYKDDDNLDSVYTLAHEGGHAMHSHYSNKSNNYMNSNYTIFEAEIASTFNECLLFEYLYKNETDEKVKIAFLEDKIQSIIGLLFRQTMFADFEYQVHNYQETKGELTVDIFYNIYGDLSRMYYGSDVDAGTLTDYVGLRIPHFYHDYYVFQYATGMSAATYLSESVLGGGKKELDDYLEFLKRGCQMFPIDNLKLAGVDMSTPKPILVLIEKFAHYVDELEKLVSKIK